MIRHQSNVEMVSQALHALRGKAKTVKLIQVQMKEMFGAKGKLREQVISRIM